MFTKEAWKLVDKNGFIDANIANFNLAAEIISTGGTITPMSIDKHGNAVGVVYADGSKNAWACIWVNELRFFRKVDQMPGVMRLVRDISKDFNKELLPVPTRDFTRNLTQTYN